MICPDCKYENIPGTDTCDNCGQDLTLFDGPAGRSPFEATIMETSVQRLAPRSPVIVPPTTTVAEAVRTLREHHIGCVLVGTPERVEGVFSERDVLLRIAHRYDEVAESAVSEHMTPDPDTLASGAPIAYALNKMSSGDYRHLPVTREGRVVGMISVRDVVRFLGEWYPDLIPAV